MGMARITFLSALILLLCFPIFSINALAKKSIETDESALLSFKFHITWDSNSTHLLSNWTEGTSVCSWIGVQCSSLHNRVVGIDVSDLGLHGTIPPQVGNLSFLSFVNISSNNFQGQLPEEMAKLSRLEYVDFSVNGISGDIPGWFGSLTNLQHLDLGNNTFSGALPSSLFNATKLEYLSLGFNTLNGPIPEQVGNLRNLWYFNVVYNQVEGSLPLSYFNLSSLQVMYLKSNRLSGELPLHICSKLPKLTNINLSFNQFSGSIQSRFGNCSKPQVLSLSLNNFTGTLPKEIGNLTGLVQLFCGYNRFQGEILLEFGNLRNLEFLSFPYNSLSGQIPNEIGNLEKLSLLDFGSNFLSGPIPKTIFNLSSLSIISFAENNLSGSLPHDIGLNLPNLVVLVLVINRLTGVVPNSISNLTKLTNLSLATNQFTGPFPSSLGNLRFLLYFSMFQNFLIPDLSTKMAFLVSLTNCRYLEEIDISQNPLNIPNLPLSIGNFSSSLEYFNVQTCGISGTIPHEFGNLSGLLGLNIGENSLTGHISPTIQKLSNLQELVLEVNQITGLIPNFLCTMKSLYSLSIAKNQMYGQVPRCFGNLTSLTYLFLHTNRLNSTLPTEIGNLRNLLLLDVSSNYLSGNITPAIGGLTAALSIALSDNNFSGNIPITIGGLGNLVNLSLSQNNLLGPIPEAFKNLLSLERLDLSHNNLTGEIAILRNLSELKHLNVSFNHFRGSVPSTGSFKKFGIDSFMPNDALCGGFPHLHFPLCDTTSHGKRSQRKKLQIVAFILIPIAVMVFLISITLFVFLRKKKIVGNVSLEELAPFSMLERISYYDVRRATNDFSGSNLLGTASFGSVYKGVLRDGAIMAVKVFNMQLEGAFKSFETECEIITNIRHRNLLRVMSSCSNLEFKALILEYMPNGSLHKWLYSHNYFLNFLQRLSIMIDVASALDYLHKGHISPIVHCDLKPSNVLLDEEMNGHVSDFGISKLLGEDEIMVRTMTLATIGYTAPEYGSEGLVSTRCDIYSFGILLMETFTRKKPTDDIFGEGYGLREMIKDNLQNSETEFIDQNLIYAEDQNSDKMVKCIVRLMELALWCVLDSPEQRAGGKDVLVELQKIKQLFFSNYALINFSSEIVF